jgi:hypothetical protein
MRGGTQNESKRVWYPLRYTTRGVDTTHSTMWGKQGRVETIPMSSQGRRSLRLDEVESTVHGDSIELI